MDPFMGIMILLDSIYNGGDGGDPTQRGVKLNQTSSHGFLEFMRGILPEGLWHVFMKIAHRWWACMSKLGVAYIMDHEVAACQRPLFHGHTSWSDLLKNVFWKPLDPWLGVNWTWTKRSEYAPNVDVLIFLNICPKRTILEFFFMFNLLSLFFYSFRVTIERFGQKNNKNILKRCFF